MADEREKGLYSVKHKTSAVIPIGSCIDVSFGLHQELRNLEVTMMSTEV